VVVTGAFRNWDPDMESRAWRLSPRSVARKTWVLAVSNPDYSVIGPSTPFKFRIDDGQWLDPPAAAPNLEAGTLVFRYGIAPPRLKAELHGPRTIWAGISGDDMTRPLDPAAYRLVDAHGNVVPIEAIIPNTASKTLVVPAEDLDIRRVYYLEVPRLKLRSRCRFDGWFRSLYSDKDLGANIHDGTTMFRILAPRAEAVRLYLYDSVEAAPEAARETIDMVQDDVGVWEGCV
jgi:hypothetical protein